MHNNRGQADRFPQCRVCDEMPQALHRYNLPLTTVVMCNGVSGVEEILHPIIRRPHEFRVVFIGVEFCETDFERSYIDIHFEKVNELKKLRFFQPVELEIEKGFSGNVCGMEILDVRHYQMDGIGVKVQNCEQDPGISFLAKKVIELIE